MQPEYMYYNDVKVTLFDNFTVSAINIKGMPNPDTDFKESGAFLTALDIEPPQTGGLVLGGIRNNSAGASGHVTLVDHKNVLYNKFIEYSRESEDRLNPPIEIVINCFTTKEIFKGCIKEWTLQFNGGAPVIEIEWASYADTGNSVNPMLFSTWRHPSKFIEMAKEIFSDGQNIDFILEIAGKENSDLDNAIRFKGENNEVIFDLSKISTCGNKLIDAYNFLVQNAVHVATAQDGSGQEWWFPLTGEIRQDDTTKFVARIKSDQENAHDTPNTEICNQLVFIQNGSYKPYSNKKGADGKSRIVIPMTDFSYSTNIKNIHLEYGIIGNKNGTIVSGNSDGTTQLSADAQTGSAEATNAAKSDAGATTITFTCYNVMSFDRNNPNSPITFEVYNEFGEKHDVSGTATVQSVKYEINGAVVKASVTATKSYNTAETESTPAQEVTGIDDQQSEQA